MTDPAFFVLRDSEAATDETWLAESEVPGKQRFGREYNGSKRGLKENGA